MRYMTELSCAEINIEGELGKATYNKYLLR